MPRQPTWPLLLALLMCACDRPAVPPEAPAAYATPTVTTTTRLQVTEPPAPTEPVATPLAISDDDAEEPVAPPEPDDAKQEPGARLGAVPRGKVKQLSVGNGHACAVMADDTLSCWSDARAISPLGKIPSGKFRSVHVGMVGACAHTLTGGVVCFGTSVLTPLAPKGTVEELCHDNGVCVRRRDGSADCATYLPDHALGTIKPGSLTCGGAWSCALALDDTIRCAMAERILALGDSSCCVGAGWVLPTGTFKAVFSGYQHGCALKHDSTALCWGRDTAGETKPPAGPFSTLALGEKFSCGLRPDGSFVCWGAARSKPRRGPFKAVQVTTHMDGLNSVCAIREDDTVGCWNY